MANRVLALTILYTFLALAQVPPDVQAPYQTPGLGPSGNFSSQNGPRVEVIDVRGQQQQASQPQAAPPRPNGAAPTQAFLLNDVSLTETIDIIAKQLKINYILDPRVKGSATLFTYGEVRPVDLMPLLETLLRVNGATMVRVGDLYRIVPINLVSPLPVEPTVSPGLENFPGDERIVLSLIFLKYAIATELDKLIAPFLNEGATHTPYEPANLIIIRDNGQDYSRSMKRTMDLIAHFDNVTFRGPAGQAVHD